MPRLTPFDEFMYSLLTWLDSAWYVWVALALTVVIGVTAVVVAKRRAKARRRIPQYRRQTGPIPVVSPSRSRP